MNRTKDELLQSCIEQFEHIDLINENETLATTKSLVMEIKKALTIPVVVKSLPQDNYCNVCNLPTDGEKCYSKRCPV